MSDQLSMLLNDNTATRESSTAGPSGSKNGFNIRAIMVAHAAMWGTISEGYFGVVQRLADGTTICHKAFHVQDVDGLIKYMIQNHKGGYWYWTCFLYRNGQFWTSDGKLIAPIAVKKSGERVTPGIKNLIGMAAIPLTVGVYSTVPDEWSVFTIERGWNFVKRLQCQDLRPASLVCLPGDTLIKGEDRGLSCAFVLDTLLSDPFEWYVTVQLINEIRMNHRGILNWSPYLPIGGTPDVILHPAPGSVFTLREARYAIRVAVSLTDPGNDWGAGQ
ncbi:hypothetical protein [Alicyclobacillus mengziensis]|uniref:Uncharacterized protein n=1 Tax=Alicyclobacillus mengziensis TaxID=2931921 RepID=A0A9X7Z948_9BACL|nr:hypothetical protein [Alicyclobacillus mengziensis]QSO49175.1 hypothetical protein JZ786_09775 [Alicyclobacillus mengziensis]